MKLKDRISLAVGVIIAIIFFIISGLFLLGYFLCFIKGSSYAMEVVFIGGFMFAGGGLFILSMVILAFNSIKKEEGKK